MDAHRRALVKATFDRLRPIPKGLGLLFYGRLFQLDPSLRPLFSENLENQAAMFATAVNVAVLGLVEDGFVPPSIHALGARHAGYGVTEPFFDTFRDAFLWTLEQPLGALFTPEVRAAWREAYETLAAAMKQSAAAAREAKAAGKSGGPAPAGFAAPA
ncbi:MAG TPA: globin domain-containing protein [Thermoanaerobaculia bacterium]|nr:globin domain-containing protein [Thermoanaerobaculia bacterium]